MVIKVGSIEVNVQKVWKYRLAYLNLDSNSLSIVCNNPSIYWLQGISVPWPILNIFSVITMTDQGFCRAGLQLWPLGPVSQVWEVPSMVSWGWAEAWQNCHAGLCWNLGVCFRILESFGAKAIPDYSPGNCLIALWYTPWSDSLFYLRGSTLGCRLFKMHTDALKCFDTLLLAILLQPDAVNTWQHRLFHRWQDPKSSS